MLVPNSEPSIVGPASSIYLTKQALRLCHHRYLMFLILLLVPFYTFFQIIYLNGYIKQVLRDWHRKNIFYSVLYATLLLISSTCFFACFLFDFIHKI